MKAPRIHSEADEGLGLGVPVCSVLVQVADGRVLGLRVLGFRVYRRRVVGLCLRVWGLGFVEEGVWGFGLSLWVEGVVVRGSRA